MYLLMLLATYLSAIYGYNLSPRPDYDRDIVRKKAAASIYRFNYQAYVAGRMISKINAYKELGGHSYPHQMLPGDKMYAENSKTMVYEQNGDEQSYLLQGNGSIHLLPEGRSLYGDDEMMSILYCLPPKEGYTYKFYDLDDYDSSSSNVPSSKNCTSGTITDPEGNVIGYTDSCCVGNMHRYLISFKSMDARWINRITNRINYDFHRALIEYPFAENIGYVYWEDGNWHFQGKIKLLPVYIKEMQEWEAAHANDPDITQRQFPSKLRNKTVWEMPSHFFDSAFFTMNGKNYCERGCLFKIRKI